MFVQASIETAAAQVISSSFSELGITGVTIQTGHDTGSVSYPLVQVICNNFVPDYPTLNIGYGKAELIIAVAAIKTQTVASVFESTADAVIEPFFSNNIVSTFNGYSTNINTLALYDKGLDVQTLKDGWMAKQVFELVVARDRKSVV